MTQELGLQLDAAGVGLRGLQAIGERTVVATGAVALFATLVSLTGATFGSSTPSFLAWGAWIGTVVLWGSAFAIPWTVCRHLCQFGLILALATVPLIAPSPSPFPWAPSTLLAFCVAVGAAVALSTGWSLVVLATAVTVAFAAAESRSSQVLITAVGRETPLGPVVYVTAIAVGFMVARRYAANVMRRVEALAETVDDATRLSERASRAAQARAAVDRRIHETVLNTLAAIANGGASSEQLRRECRRDLEQMQLGFMPQAEQGLSAIVRSAIHVAGEGEAFVAVDISKEVDLERGPAGALRDALVESLRNVHRHARARTVRITAHSDGVRAFVTVADDGVGMEVDVQERFGVRNSIRASLAAMGGSAEVISRPNEGTTVQLVAPLSLRPPAVDGAPLRLPKRGRFIGRLGLIASVITVCVLLPWTYPGPSAGFMQVMLPMTAFTCVCVCVAYPASRRVLLPLSWLAVALGLVLVLVAASQVDGCATAPIASSVIAAVMSSLFLIFIEVGRGLAPKVAALLIFVTACLVLVFLVPGECRNGSATILVILLMFVLGLWWIFHMTLTAVTAQEQARREAVAQLLEDEVQLTEFLESRAAWEKVTGTTKEVLAAIADGTVDPSDLFVRQRARIEQSQLRAKLGGQQVAGLWQAVLDAADAAAQRSRTVDVNVITSGHEDRIVPAPVSQALVDMFTTAPSGTISARLLFLEGEEEVVLSGPEEYLTTLHPALTSSSIEAVGIDGGQRSQVILRWVAATRA